MDKEKIKVGILPNQFLKDDGTFDKEEALKLSGQIAGVCYDEEGFDHIKGEPEEKTLRRVNMTLENGHHSVYDHVEINFNIQNIPKILAMIINNEKMYTTSEKSGRYTPVEESLIVSAKEIELYKKWVAIFTKLIKENYGDYFSDFKIRTLAQENARYLVTVFVPAQMIYSTSLRQINYIASWMLDYIKNVDFNDDFQRKVADYMKDFIGELDHLNVLDERLMRNEKNRKIALFGENLDNIEEYFGDVYSVIYDSSFTSLAQAERHRTLNYKIELLDEKRYYIPPILRDDKALVNEWLKDMLLVSSITPQGEIIKVWESGTYEDFIKKLMERLCTSAQLEIAIRSKELLERYKKALEEKNHPLASDIEKYTHGARCTFDDYECPNRCNFPEGINLTRKI